MPTWAIILIGFNLGIIVIDFLCYLAVKRSLAEVNSLRRRVAELESDHKIFFERMLAVGSKIVPIRAAKTNE